MLFRRKNAGDETPTLHDLVEDESVTPPAHSIRARL